MYMCFIFAFLFTAVLLLLLLLLFYLRTMDVFCLKQNLID